MRLFLGHQVDDKQYVTGFNGFLGTHLTKRIGDFIGIHHQDIPQTKIDGFSKFFFLSAYGNMAFHTESDKIVKANVSDLIHFLNQIDFKKTFRSFVYISTSSIKLKRQTMYSRTKKAAEEILLSYAEKYDMPICIIRPFSITGVGEQKEHLIPTLIRSCMEGDRIDFVPKPVHDFIDVEDVVAGILNLSNHSAKGIFELGTGIGYTNQQVLELVQEVTGKEANVDVVYKLRDYDNEEWISNNYRARMYGWLNRKSLKQSIQEMVEEYKAQKERGV